MPPTLPSFAHAIELRGWLLVRPRSLVALCLSLPAFETGWLDVVAGLLQPLTKVEKSEASPENPREAPGEARGYYEPSYHHALCPVAACY